MTSHHYLTAARCSLVVAVSLTAGIACAQQPLLVYGPGGPAPAMKEAAAFEHANGIKVTVTAGPTPSWSTTQNRMRTSSTAVRKR